MKYCEHVAHTISFNKKDILPCCTTIREIPPTYFNPKLESSDIVSSIDIGKKQEETFKMLNSQEINKRPCVNCIFCKEVAEMPKDDYKINAIFLRQWIKDDNADKNFSDSITYDPYDLIKQMYETDKIDTQNLIVKIQSTNMEEVVDIDKYLDLFIRKGVKEIHISSNIIIFNKKVANLIDSNKATINTSLDAGTPETYKKIKGDDSFNKIIESLKNYQKYLISSKYGICIHYVLFKDLNDNKKELNNFIQLMKELDINCIGIRINQKELIDILENKNENTKLNDYRSLITYFYEKAIKNSFNIDKDSCIEQNFLFEKKDK